MIRIAHISDFHHDGTAERLAMIRDECARVVACRPDVVVMSGDITDRGTQRQFRESITTLDALGDLPTVIIPGNRDVADVRQDDDAHTGIRYRRGDEPTLMPLEDASMRFAYFIGQPNTVLRLPGVCVVGIDTNAPVSSRVRDAARRAFRSAGDDAVRVLALHHPLLPVPRKKLKHRDIVSNAGDLLALAASEDVDVVCTGHHHRSHVAHIHWEGVDVHMSMAPMLTHETPKRHRGFHIIDIDHQGACRITPVRTESFRNVDDTLASLALPIS